MAWSIGILSIALMLAGLVFMFVDRGAFLPDVSDSWTFSSVFDVAVNIAVPVIGLVIASRRRENPLGWLLLAAGIVLGVVNFSRAYAPYALVADPVRCRWDERSPGSPTGCGPSPSPCFLSSSSCSRRDGF